ncbi:MAG: DegV family protein [Roseburia sp.]|nr:DegV family protein [Roseburia sp.]
MKIKIISDSSSNMYSMDGVDFASVPLRIVTNEKEYVDNTELDVAGMVDDLSAYKGRSGTACPGVGDYLDAFEGYDEIYCVTITSNLSGSYNAAMTAKQQYEEENPNAKVHIVDSLSAGSELKLHLNKLKELILEGKVFETIVSEIEDYKENHTRLQFCLESLHNLANNGRVNPAVAKIAGLVGLRMVGDATGGVLNPNDKCRGEKKAISTLFSNMKKAGYKGGKVLIDHCLNTKAAETLKELVLTEFPNAHVELGAMGGLCSFYAEKGGMIIGYEV